ncbi:MAG: riboflavin synthase [Micromonosporaceae bacterium]
MFTGIVEELGEVVRREPTSTGARLTINGPLVISDAENGDSIAVNGVCLTVAGQDRHAASFVADLMTETLDRTTLGQLGVGDQVNLERAATLGTRLGGHLVQGHIDGVGSVTGRTAGERVDITVGVPAGLTRYLVEKGSITVDGVSLTVVSVGDTWFSVSLIPTTLRETTFGTRAVGDHVNLEVDVIAKYVERLVRYADSEVTA